MNWKIKSFVVAGAAVAATVLSYGAATANVVSISFGEGGIAAVATGSKPMLDVVGEPNSSLVTSGADSYSGGATGNSAVNYLSGSTTAGVVAAGNWNNVDAPHNNGSGGLLISNLGTIVDNTGAATTISGEVGAAGSTWDESTDSGHAAPLASNGDQVMMEGGLYGNTTSLTNFNQLVVSITNVPYATYDIYVYEMPDNSNVQGISLGTATGITSSGAATFTATTTYWAATPTPDGGGYIDGTSSTFNYLQATSTSSSSPTANADYALFTNVTGSSFAIASAGGDKGVISGIQIVDTTAVPAPSSLSLLGIGTLGLLAIGTRRRFCQK